MKYKRNKLKELEKSRKSIFTDDLKSCIMCNEPATDINEIFMGRNRLNSMKYNLCIPLCRRCHQKYHLERATQLYWMRKAQIEFEKTHSFEDWMKIFLRNYKD
jgi:hypothetical protein